QLRIEVSLFGTEAYLVTQFIGQLILIIDIKRVHATGHIKIVAYRIIRLQAVCRVDPRILMLQTTAHSGSVTRFEFMAIAKRKYIIKLDVDVSTIFLGVIDSHELVHFLWRRRIILVKPIYPLFAV